ncbi:peptidylprolyl isomerase [Alkalimarinus coralli]|uniref:peptidylprolyl isomerase n=1 Tax=Alkalimarinus coralli TaxID=2935863 RepID=UPI00202B4CCF|nr:peptidylprolyl isomerase [Alkalimarinus coralli]
MLLKNILFRCLTLTMLFLLTLSTAYGKVKPLDHVLVIVDDDIVMVSELEARIKTITARLKAQGTALPPASVMSERVLDQLILESIQLQMAERNGLRVDDNQLNETMQNIAKRNGYTLDEFQEEIKSEGVTYNEAREQIRRELLISRLQQRQVDRKVRVTDKEVETFLASSEGKRRTATEYYLGHILVSISDPANPVIVEEARKRAEGIVAELNNGADFKQTAVAKSDGRNALQGGVIGWRKENEVPSIAADIIQTLKVGKPSELLRTPSGFHIMSVLDKRGGKEQLVKQFNVRHILIKPSEVRTEQEAKTIIEQLRERIISGDDFAAIAKAHSEDPVSAISGGDLEWVSPGEMVPAFDDIMQHSKVGEISEPFLSDFGWHILQVQDTRMEDLGNRIQANQARRVIHRRKYDEELTLWLREIREEAFIEFKYRDGSE